MAERPFWKILRPDARGGGSAPPAYHYEILQEIASGGMATVYLGSRVGPDGVADIVALKRALPLREAGDSSALLVREARLAARVCHANIVSVLDVDAVEGAALLVLDYVDGPSLAQLCGAGPIPSGVLARILLDACAGLDAVHSARGEDGSDLGLVHRDVSPQNLLVGSDGVTRVADFGIARTARCPRTTCIGGRRGKPGYMAPEYVTGADATPASDVFALGVIAWEALTGRRLYGGATTLEHVLALHESRVTPPSHLVPSAPDAWNEVVLRALGHGQRRRFGTARELERTLLLSTDIELATHTEVGRFVEEVAFDTLWLRRAIIDARLGSGVSEPVHSKVWRTTTQPEYPVRELHERPTMPVPESSRAKAG